MPKHGEEQNEKNDDGESNHVLAHTGYRLQGTGDRRN
jgi:hypothetical protein